MTHDWNSLTNSEFRAEMVRFVTEHCPDDLRHFANRQRWAIVKPWFQILSRHGWIAPGWPVQYGGMGLSPLKHLIYIEELERLGAPRLLDQSLTNLGPILIARGTEEQRLEYLPAILAGEQVWCQGYSEPNAGSDLASVRTEGRLEGDDVIINGHKIWTSMAFDATHMFALIRTDKAAKKQAGITFIMFKLDQPGITIRPIRDISGSEEFCEVFLTDVRAHRRDIVGELNGGWGIAKTLLGFERIWAGSPRQSQMALRQLERLARATDLMNDQVFADKLAQVTFDVMDLASTYKASVQVLDVGKGFGFESSLLKIIATETCQRVTELLVEAAGAAGGLEGVVTFGPEELNVLTFFLESRLPTIYGGSSQIQRNILARNVLKLPV